MKRLNEAQKFKLSLIAWCALIIKMSGAVEKHKIDAAMNLLVVGTDKAEDYNNLYNTLLAALAEPLDGNIIATQLENITTQQERLILLRAFWCLMVEIEPERKQRQKVMASIGDLLGISTWDQSCIQSEYIKKIPTFYYARLGLKPGVTKSEVKSAYRNLALKHHPDRIRHHNNTSVDKATAQFQQINEAYNALLKALS